MKYQIWREGFHIQGGGPVEASFVGTSDGNTFEEAVKKWYNQHPERLCNFNPETLSDWSCKLFPTEAQARELFG